jgi:UDP-N-acetyl-D-glucosamine dehydrogenase
MGLAYKPNVDDMRESPTFVLMEILETFGAEVAFYDPYIPEIAPTREHAKYTGMQSVNWDEETIRSFDLAIIATDHKDVDYTLLLAWSKLVVDSRNVYKQSVEKVFQA